MASKRKPVVDNKKRKGRVQPAPAAPPATPPPALRSNTESSVSDKKPAADGNPADRNVDQIRDILFGGQMRDYERRFQELNERIEADFDALRQDQERRIVQLEKRLDEHFEKLSKALRQEITDRTAAVDDLETRLVQGARTQRSELTGAIDALEQSQTSAEERLRAALADLEAALKDQAGRLNQSLTRSRDELRADKVGREDLAALMTEVALRLKGDFDLPGGR